MYQNQEFIDMMEKNYLDKGQVINVLNIYVYGSKFLQHLDKFINKEGEREQFYGVVYSEDFEKDDDGYFGENKILFYAGDYDDIIDYEDLYLYFTCEFYIEKHEDEKEIVQEKLLLIEEAYGIE
ncbi:MULTISPECIES: ribonuclease toxin immunity protein CdiI [unclassified Clostridium]|uniref:ribonuclease toxin immunity protein CdiI n=1 Tax=unclassified Clostridium TaxID=2614128 RepID=UPI00207956F8|nr:MULTISPECIES: ribonuclease toxin immunity protein CdiI [unclassified Clostridium]